MKKNISHDDIPYLARRQLLDYRATTPGTCFSNNEFRLDITTAYQLQDAVTALRIADGERVIGYKVGCTGPGTTEQFGMDGPIRGTLFADEVLNTGVTLDPDAFYQLAIEGEMAVRLGEDFQIEAAFPVIELHNFVFRSAQKSLPELIANNGINAGIVLPEYQWQQSKTHIINDAVLTVIINATNVGEANLWPKGGGPQVSIEWIKNHLADYGRQLEPGHIILAGTALGLYPVKSGDNITVLINGKPAVQCAISTVTK